ncbi:MAG TPA: hypothetical protein VLK34_07170 [Nocardioidaceae bacterium]|nr:hypothetical protein [Nocardioidaceae bacterium]
MRWRRLFEDLETQAAALDEAELRNEIADRTRAELAGVPLSRRLHSALGAAVELRLLGDAVIRGQLSGWGPDWLLVDSGDEVVVSTPAIVAAARLGEGVSAPAGIGLVESRTSITTVLRAIARDRSAVAVRLIDGSQIIGTPDRVGADWIDIAAHDVGDAPRPPAVQGRWTVPLGSMSLIRRSTVGWQ